MFFFVYNCHSNLAKRFIYLKLTTLGTYAPSFGALCAVTFEVERERALAKNIPGPDEPKVHVRLVPSGRGV